MYRVSTQVSSPIVSVRSRTTHPGLTQRSSELWSRSSSTMPCAPNAPRAWRATDSSADASTHWPSLLAAACATSACWYPGRRAAQSRAAAARDDAGGASGVDTRAPTSLTASLRPPPPNGHGSRELRQLHQPDPLERQPAHAPNAAVGGAAPPAALPCCRRCACRCACCCAGCCACCCACRSCLGVGCCWLRASMARSLASLGRLTCPSSPSLSKPASAPHWWKRSPVQLAAWRAGL